MLEYVTTSEPYSIVGETGLVDESAVDGLAVSVMVHKVSHEWESNVSGAEAGSACHKTKRADTVRTLNSKNCARQISPSPTSCRLPITSSPS